MQRKILALAAVGALGAAMTTGAMAAHMGGGGGGGGHAMSMGGGGGITSFHTSPIHAGRLYAASGAPNKRQVIKWRGTWC